MSRQLDIQSEAYNDGWSDGYAAGFQQALTCAQDALTNTIKAQRSGILAQDAPSAVSE